MNDSHHDRENEPAPGRLPPGLLGISFLLVAGGYILLLIGIFAIFAILVKTGFPEVDKLFLENQGNKGAMQNLFETDPESVLPRTLFWSLFAGSSVFCLVAGWLVARLAPFAKFPHAFFLAVLTFVTFLQFTVSVSGDGKWMFLVLMIGLPVFILGGGKVASPGARREN